MLQKAVTAPYFGELDLSKNTTSSFTRLVVSSYILPSCKDKFRKLLGSLTSQLHKDKITRWMSSPPKNRKRGTGCFNHFLTPSSVFWGWSSCLWVWLTDTFLGDQESKARLLQQSPALLQKSIEHSHFRKIRQSLSRKVTFWDHQTSKIGLLMVPESQKSSIYSEYPFGLTKAHCDYSCFHCWQQP